MAKHVQADSSAKTYSQAELEAAEKAALEKVSRAISSVESAIAAYETLKEKPEALKSRVEKLRFFHKNLSEWTSAVLRASGKDSEEARVERLKKLYQIASGWG